MLMLFVMIAINYWLHMYCLSIRMIMCCL